MKAIFVLLILIISCHCWIGRLIASGASLAGSVLMFTPLAPVGVVLKVGGTVAGIIIDVSTGNVLGAGLGVVGLIPGASLLKIAGKAAETGNVVTAISATQAAAVGMAGNGANIAYGAVNTISNVANTVNTVKTTTEAVSTAASLLDKVKTIVDLCPK